MLREIAELAQPWLLEPHRYHPAQSGHPMLRWWKHPFFFSHTTWEITRSGRAYWLRQLTWRKDLDGERYAGVLPGMFGVLKPRPTIEIVDRSIEEEQLQDLFRGLSRIRIPLDFAAPIGLDGTGYGLETFAQNRVRLRWWDCYPSQWAELHRWFAETCAWVEALK